MIPGPIDISSDEDAAARFDSADDDWLSNLIESGDGNFEKDDEDDDVVVIGEVNAASKPKKVDDDEDCVVLDGDPDKAVSVEEDGSGSGSDDLVVVGEKGQDIERKRKRSHNVSPQIRLLVVIKAVHSFLPHGEFLQDFSTSASAGPLASLLQLPGLR